MVQCKDETRSQGTPPPPPSASASKRDGHVRERRRDTRHRCRERLHSFPANGVLAWSGASRRGILSRSERRRKNVRRSRQAQDRPASLCTTALDGGCEEYKKFGVTRSVIVHYIANAGVASVEVFLSRFANDGAYTIYTTRLTGEDRSRSTSTPRAPSPILGFWEMSSASGALGTGKGVRAAWSVLFRAHVHERSRDARPD